MIKELKYLFFVMVIFFFLIFTIRFYFSDKNQKRTYRSINFLDKKIKNSENNLILLRNNTKHIIEYVEINDDKKTKKYSFYELIYND